MTDAVETYYEAPPEVGHCANCNDEIIVCTDCESDFEDSDIIYCYTNRGGRRRKHYCEDCWQQRSEK